MVDREAIRLRWELDGSKRDERGRRLFAASEARAAGWGGLEAVSTITGIARSTIGRGLDDLDLPPLPPGRVRREGGGGKTLTARDATLLEDLRRLVEPATRGDPVRQISYRTHGPDRLNRHRYFPDLVDLVVVARKKFDLVAVPLQQLNFGIGHRAFTATLLVEVVGDQHSQLPPGGQGTTRRTGLSG